MTTPIQARHTFPCTSAEFWAMYFDPGYNAMVNARLDLAECREISRQESESEVRTRMRIVPKREMPAPLRRAVPSLTAAYEEERTFYKTEGRLLWKVIPDFRPDALTCEGTYQVKDLADGTCLRVLAGSITVRIFGIGTLVEKTVAGDVERSYALAAEVGREWLERFRRS